ncbi:MAG: DUF5667 domain-containing protein [Chloroflexota bacterium]
MKPGDKFNEILNECLESLVSGQSIETCLEKHPEQAEALRPLLEIALSARRASAISPRPGFREKARLQFRTAVRGSPSAKETRRFHLRFGMAGAVSLALVILISGISTVAVAGSSMPDQPLYPVKLATEETKVALAPSPIKKAEVHVRLADFRVDEIVYVAVKGEPRWVDTVTQRLREHLDMVAALAAIRANGRTPPQPGTIAPRPPTTTAQPARGQDNRARLKVLIQQKAVRNTEKLKETLNRAPLVVKPNLNRTITQASASYQRALLSIERSPEQNGG